MTIEPDGKKPTTAPSAAPKNDKTEKSPKTESYAEHDKLGPLPAVTAVAQGFGGDGDLGGAVLAAFRDSVDRARRAGESTTGGPDDTVHEYRKGLRRARAILALIADAVPEREVDEITDILRQARHAVSVARDHAVAPRALSALELDDDVRTTATSIIVSASGTAPSRDAVMTALREGAARAVATAESLAQLVPPAVGWAVVAEGLADTYREARRQLGKAKRSRRALHTWRRRTRELSYQLGLLAKGAGERTATLASRVEDLSDDLGAVVDLIMLRNFVHVHAGAADPAAVDALTSAIDDRLKERSRAARRKGKEIFDRGGRRFARRVLKALRRDLAPPPPTKPPADGATIAAS